jgi:ssDNA-binding Zn-finger/Zn-ribbon topoisomerase 1
MNAARVGYAEGKCPVCGKRMIRKRPSDLAICDCYEYCPLCGAKMQPFTPDLTPRIYEPEKGLEVFYVCNNHMPPYYSKQKPVEVHLS